MSYPTSSQNRLKFNYPGLVRHVRQVAQGSQVVEIPDSDPPADSDHPAEVPEQSGNIVVVDASSTEGSSSSFEHQDLTQDFTQGRWRLPYSSQANPQGRVERGVFF